VTRVVSGTKRPRLKKERKRNPSTCIRRSQAIALDPAAHVLGKKGEERFYVSGLAPGFRPAPPSAHVAAENGTSGDVPAEIVVREARGRVQSGGGGAGRGGGGDSSGRGGPGAGGERHGGAAVRGGRLTGPTAPSLTA